MNDNREFLYVGESTNQSNNMQNVRWPIHTIQSGLSRKYNYKFSNLVHLKDRIEIHFFTFGPASQYKIIKKNVDPKFQTKYLVETIEAEIAFAIKVSNKGNMNWPTYQNEIHFHPEP
jgi:hypothetical protein